ncbi:MAG: AMP-binding protein [Chitinophagales bacterium]|nr:AMP-binding protein [Chitinophagales bacterium]
MKEVLQFFENSTSTLYDATLTIQSTKLLHTASTSSREVVQYINQKHTVAYLTENSPLDFLFCEVLLSHLDCYLFPISFESFKNDADYILQHLNIHYILLDSSILNNWLIRRRNWELIKKIKGIKNIIYLLKNNEKIGIKPFNSIESSIILSTSGTSSNKKFIIQSPTNFKESINVFSSTSLFKNKKKYINLLPLYFSGGRKVFYSCISNNIDIHFADSFHIEDPFDLTSGTPFILKRLIENNPKTKYQGQSFICGGAKLSLELISKAESVGLKVYNVYGLTETSSIASYNTPDSNLPSSVGKLCSINQYKIINNKLFIKGPTVSQYQIINKRLHPILNQDGWLQTNDIVKKQDGYLFIKGRSDSKFKLSNGLFTTSKRIMQIIQSYISIKEFDIHNIENDHFEIYLDRKYIERQSIIIDACINLNKNESFIVQKIKFTKSQSDINKVSFKKDTCDNAETILNVIIDEHDK